MSRNIIFSTTWMISQTLSVESIQSQGEVDCPCLLTSHSDIVYRVYTPLLWYHLGNLLLVSHKPCRTQSYDELFIRHVYRVRIIGEGGIL